MNIFQTPRLRFRAVDPPEDIGLLRDIHNDHEGFSSASLMNTRLTSYSDTFEWANSLVGQPTCYVFAIICLRQDCEGLNDPEHIKEIAIGQIHLAGGHGTRTLHHRNAEFGIHILPKYQREGYGSEAIAWALDYAFQSVGLHRVSAKEFGYNEGAIKLYTKLLFREEGRLKEELWWERRWWDVIVFGMLATEWPDKRKKLNAGGSGVLIRF